MTSSISPTEPVRPATQFTLLQILLLTAGFAVGLAIWRLPKSTPTDVPLALISSAFAWSLAHKAVTEKRRLAVNRRLSGPQRAGCWLQVMLLSGLSVTFIFGLCLLALAANGIIYKTPKDIFIPLVKEFLPGDVLAVAMIVSLIIGNRSATIVQASAGRNRLYSVFNAAGSWLAIWLFAVWSIIVPMLVCIAVMGIELSSSPRFFPEDLDQNIAIRIQRFTTISILGGIIALSNMVLISVLRQSDFSKRKRWLCLVALIVGLMIQLLVANEITNRSIQQLAPPMAEGRWWPTTELLLTVGVLILLVSLPIAWRSSISHSPLNEDATEHSRPRFFHEQWPAAMLVALLGVGIYVQRAVDIELGAFTYNIYEEALTLLFGWPSQLILMAMVVAGMMQFWTRWRNRFATVTDLPVAVNLPKLIVLTLAVSAFLTTAGPIFAAMGLSFWFSPLTKLF
jgi:hypothetical protein